MFQSCQYPVFYRCLRVFILFVFLFNLQFISTAQNTHDSAYDRSLIKRFFETQASVKYMYQCTLNYNATAIAWCFDGSHGQTINYKFLQHSNDSTRQITASSAGQSCNETEPQWSPNQNKIAFLSDAKTPGKLQVFIADADKNALINQQWLTDFNGYVSHLCWSPDGKYLSVLYVENASRDPSPMAAENKTTGLIDSALNRNVQRIVIINISNGEIRHPRHLGGSGRSPGARRGVGSRSRRRSSRRRWSSPPPRSWWHRAASRCDRTRSWSRRSGASSRGPRRSSPRRRWSRRRASSSPRRSWRERRPAPAGRRAEGGPAAPGRRGAGGPAAAVVQERVIQPDPVIESRVVPLPR